MNCEVGQYLAIYLGELSNLVLDLTPVSKFGRCKSKLLHTFSKLSQCQKGSRFIFHGAQLLSRVRILYFYLAQQEQLEQQ